MKKINILVLGPKYTWGFTFGYWSLLHFFNKELEEEGYTFKFYTTISSDFFDCDFIFVTNKFFSQNKLSIIKKKIDTFNINYSEISEKISKKNKNLIWFDMSDSAGNTQFEVMPYVKYYAKGQIYNNKSYYKKNFFRGRYYSDYYQKKFNLEINHKFNYQKLEDEFENKLILSWNIGVGNYFNNIDYNILKKYFIQIQNFFTNDKKKFFKYVIKNYKNNQKTTKIFHKSNLRNLESKKSIHFQRIQINEILKSKFKINFSDKRISHKNFLKSLLNSKISVGCFGWGEVCYREFEAAKMGAAIFFPNMDYIKTWPNIYSDGETYMSYNLDFSNFEEGLENLLKKEDFRNKITYNAQYVCKKIFEEEGFNYLINFLKKVTK